MTDSQIRITNIVYTAMSFLSFISGAASIFLNHCYYHYCNKDRYQGDILHGMLILALVVFSTFELFESFQWILLLNNVASCTVLGAIKEYIMISILVVIVCFGIHLLILMTSPKCLQVITEVKQKRYKMLLRAYVIASLLIPLTFLPWPFITMTYGRDEYVCWLADTDHCNVSDVHDVVGRLLMWHMWAVIVWVFAVIMILLAFYQYCVHRSASKGTKSKPSGNVPFLISLLTFFIIAVTANALPFVWELITKKSSFSLALQAAILTPLMLMVYTMITTVQKMCVMRTGPDEIIPDTSITTLGMSYGTSATNFVLPEDEWD